MPSFPIELTDASKKSCYVAAMEIIPQWASSHEEWKLSEWKCDACDVVARSEQAE